MIGTEAGESYDTHYYRTRPSLRPYCMRRLWPWLTQKLSLRVKSGLSAVLLSPTAALVGLHFGSFWFSVLFMSLGMVRTCFKFPGLTDPPALFCLSLSLYTGRWEWAAFGALFNEKSAIFGACFVHPLALVGLVFPGRAYLSGERARPEDPEWLRRPVRAALANKDRFGDARYWLLPWGTALSGLAGVNLNGSIALALGYGQLLTAQDGPRLYMWAFPALFSGVPLAWLPILAVLNWANPYRQVL